MCKCIQVDSLLKEDNLIVSVPDFEVVESEGIIFNIGAKTEIWFTIVSNIVKGKTKRLAEDFEWLSTTISRIFPIFAVTALRHRFLN